MSLIHRAFVRLLPGAKAAPLLTAAAAAAAPAALPVRSARSVQAPLGFKDLKDPKDPFIMPTLSTPTPATSTPPAPPAPPAQTIIDYTTGPGGQLDIASSDFRQKVEWVATKTKSDSWTIEPYTNSHWESVNPDTGQPQGRIIVRTLAIVVFRKRGHANAHIDAYLLNGIPDENGLVTGTGPANAVNDVLSRYGLPQIPNLPPYRPPEAEVSPIGAQHPRSNRWWYLNAGAPRPGGGDWAENDEITSTMNGPEQKFVLVRHGTGGFFTNNAEFASTLLWEMR